jgi:hypothetical protein
MRVKHLAKKNKMVKGKATHAATSWVPSVFTQKELDKAKVDGLIFDSDSIIFPSTERIPKPKSGFRVMFLAFLLRGLSLLPTSSFVGFFMCTVCSFTSSHQIPFFISPAL